MFGSGTKKLGSSKNQVEAVALPVASDPFPVVPHPAATSLGAVTISPDPALGATAMQIMEYAKYLGMNPIYDADYLWIAEEALCAPLPEDWRELYDPHKNLYYFNTRTQESAWEHPLDAYYRFVYSKMVALDKVRRPMMQPPGDPSPHEHDPRLDELLMLLGQDNTPRSREASASILFYMHFYSGERREANFRESYNPVTPEEVKEMTRFLKVDYHKEFYLLPIARRALRAPLPPYWEEYEDDERTPYYFNRRAGLSSYNHPSDEYFRLCCNQEREAAKQRNFRSLTPMSRASTPNLYLGPWMKFKDADGRDYWFNFATGEETAQEPIILREMADIMGS